jgi:insertion element IS1 protein InsB
LRSVNTPFLAAADPDALQVDIVKIDKSQDVGSDNLEVEMDEMWSYVGSKTNQRWLWHAIDRATGTVLA